MPEQSHKDNLSAPCQAEQKTMQGQLCLQSRQRLQWQCRRGMLELELFLQNFLEHDYDALSLQQKYDFEQLLTIIDPVLFDYLMGMQEADDPGLRDIVHTIRTAHQQRLHHPS